MFKLNCSSNEIIPENPRIKNQKSAITVILTMSEVLHVSTTQRGETILGKHIIQLLLH